ncbi:MAG: M20/M25/M40 family metallo-hydrolase [Deltaproteobacteria bacterium]|nr:M20/M25/M40 family metallo-hydrolase [Deltaproteobacteria bacterium]
MRRKSPVQLSGLLVLISHLAALSLGCAGLPPAWRAQSSIQLLSRLPPESDAEAIEVFSKYLQVDTSNPPGNELLGARHLAERLASVGIDSELVPLRGSATRGSLIAHLRGDKSVGGPLCLLSHIDVVPALASEWTHPPFSGHVDDQGVIWGRGALDMKSMGAIELLAMLWLKRLDVKLGRDVVLIAVADEEDANRGMIELVEDAWDRLGCEYLLNEGGLGLRDLLFAGQTVFPISVAEKGVLWIDVEVRGEGGHGSTPRPEHAARRYLDALKRLDRWKSAPRIHPSLYELLSRVGRHRGFPESLILGSRWMVNTFLEETLLENPATRAAITDTAYVTGFDSGGNLHNVVPSRMRARIDSRILPGTRTDEMLRELSALAGPDAKLSIRFAAEALESSSADPVFDVLVRHVEADRRDAVAGPALSPGFTDSLYARKMGAKAYGFVPFEVSKELATTYHAANERLPAAAFLRGFRVLLGAVAEISARSAQ